jgi:hypothetical protein
MLPGKGAVAKSPSTQLELNIPPEIIRNSEIIGI